jgi:predicted transglutaminase-like cysteine proteinase
MRLVNKKYDLKVLLGATFLVATIALFVVNRASAKEEMHRADANSYVLSLEMRNKSTDLILAGKSLFGNVPRFIASLAGDIFSNLTMIPSSFALDPIRTSAVSQGYFDTVAVPFSAIGVRGQWDRAREQSLNEKGICNSKLCDARIKRVRAAINLGRTRDVFTKLAIANSTANLLIKYQSDQEIYGSFDYWASARDTIRLGSGDCEDFVILKQNILLAMDVDEDNISAVVLRDKSRDLYHAVLAIRTSKGNLILDNVRNEIFFDTDLPQYQPLFSFSGARSWVHGRISKNKSLVARSLNNPVNVAPSGGDSTYYKSIAERKFSPREYLSAGQNE